VKHTALLNVYVLFLCLHKIDILRKISISITRYFAKIAYLYRIEIKILISSHHQ